MIKLTASEEKLMLIIWKKENILLSEIISYYGDPKPAKTTIATLLKRLSNKEAIGYTMLENKRQYFSKLKKSDFSSNTMQTYIRNFFNNSASQLASFCTTENNLSTKELEDLRAIIDKKIKENDSI